MGVYNCSSRHANQQQTGGVFNECSAASRNMKSLNDLLKSSSLYRLINKAWLKMLLSFNLLLPAYLLDLDFRSVALKIPKWVGS